MIRKKILIDGYRYEVWGDTDYLGLMGDAFEPDTVDILQAFCASGSTVIDIGANIGLTSLALSGLCEEGQVVAIEPVPVTFRLLEKNLSLLPRSNVLAINKALGDKDGSVAMYVNESNLATAFVVSEEGCGDLEIPLTTLDSLVADCSLASVDFIKIDVEGHELDVLRGARKTLGKFRPNVLLEMNHWCLNVFRRTSLPEFHETLLEVFPFVFAVEKGRYLDFTERDNVGDIFQQHVFANEYMHIVAGFDRADLLRRLESLERTPLAEQALPASATPSSEIDYRLQLEAVLNSTSWKITAPLRKLASLVGWKRAD
ncbi:FkbM family methyltransferase [Pseudomonas aeruginosa]|uniref:FkbM family methyltransferase n=1 Tax=Pseudomonas aeruginosa TaxID=287 RepID=UPI001558BF00|nr:FkbM family methyltransferase [Pseudomonas aeruginosa]NPW34770.1 FkbM family methyltransferase [Pseudomonas aeruginosa]